MTTPRDPFPSTRISMLRQPDDGVARRVTLSSLPPRLVAVIGLALALLVAVAAVSTRAAEAAAHFSLS